MPTNPSLKVTFLGTGTSQGVPVIGCECKVCQSANPKDKRLRTSVLIQKNGKNIVVDTGPDFRQQMLRAKVKKLDAVLFTHEHKDHVAGMDDIRAFNYLQQAPINIYATHQVQEALKREFHYVFAEDKYPGIPEINTHTIDNTSFNVEGIEITPILVMHQQLPVMGFRVDGFVYITDANYIPSEEKHKIEGCEVLVLNALRKQEHVSHFTLEEAVELMEEFKPKQGYFTHISHQLGSHDKVSAELPPFVALGYDEMQIEL